MNGERGEIKSRRREVENVAREIEKGNEQRKGEVELYS